MGGTQWYAHHPIVVMSEVKKYRGTMVWIAFHCVPATPSPEENTPGKRVAKHAAKFLNVAGVEMLRPTFMDSTRQHGRSSHCFADTVRTLGDIIHKLAFVSMEC